MRIAYVDLEVNEQTKKIGDIGVLCGETCLHTAKVFDAVQIIQAADLICGHHFLHHDFHYLQEDLAQVHRYQEHIIDTLLLSPLLQLYYNTCTCIIQVVNHINMYMYYCLFCTCT